MENTTKAIHKIYVERVIDSDADLSYLTEYQGGKAGEKYTDKDNVERIITKEQEAEWRKQDQDLLDDYNNGLWHMLGIRARAEIIVEGVIQTIHSAGLWNIESSSKESYLQEVEQDELFNLKSILKQLGFSEKEFHEIEVNKIEP